MALNPPQSQGGSWHENSLFGEPRHGKGVGGGGLEGGDAAPFSSGTGAHRALADGARGGFGAAHGLRGKGRGRNWQAGLCQQGCIFPGA